MEINEGAALKILSNIPEENAFILRDGSKLSNLYELNRKLKKISNEDFNFHVTEEKNDFANWIRHVQKDEALANEMREISSKSRIQHKIKLRIKELENIINKSRIKKSPERLSVLNKELMLNRLKEVYL